MQLTCLANIGRFDIHRVARGNGATKRNKTHPQSNSGLCVRIAGEASGREQASGVPATKFRALGRCAACCCVQAWGARGLEAGILNLDNEKPNWVTCL
jgi:hypothetical protein